MSPSALNALLASSRESIDGNVDMAAASPEATHHGAAAAAATAGANATTVTRRHAKTPRSCLKGARKQHMLGLEGTGVRFGSPQAAVFTRDTPAVSMTPLAKEVNIHTSPCYSLRARMLTLKPTCCPPPLAQDAKSLFPMSPSTGSDPTDDDEDTETAANSALLASMDAIMSPPSSKRLVQAQRELIVATSLSVCDSCVCVCACASSLPLYLTSVVAAASDLARQPARVVAA